MDERVLEEYFDRLWPICRSITGKGFVDSLNILSELIPLEKHTWNTGENILDWVVPPVWNIIGAQIWRPNGNVILDFANNNLHIAGYSTPQSGCLPWKLLREHVYTVPELSYAVPYITSYFQPSWGFCMTQKQYDKLDEHPEALYYFNINSSLQHGQLVVGDYTFLGKAKDEIFLSTYLCHPTAVDGLSGPLVMAGIYQKLKNIKLRHTIRFVVGPENIGMIAYLSRFGEQLKKNVVGGYILSTVGHRYVDKPYYYYKKSKQGYSLADKAALHILKHRGDVNVLDYFPNGSDERVTETQAYNLGIGLIMRKMYGNYPEYHTSADNKSLIHFESLLDMIDAYVVAIMAMDSGSRIFDAVVKHGTPMFTKHSKQLYQSTMKLNSFIRPTKHREILLDLACYCDGQTTLLDIANKCGHYVFDMLPVVDELMEVKLLKEVV